MASPAPARPQPGGGARPAPCPRARRRNQARVSRRRVTRPRTGAGDTRETGFRRAGRPAAGRGATGGGRRQRPLPPRPARNRAEECVLRPALARAQAQSGAPPRNAPAGGRADGRRRYARNRVPPHRPAGGGPGCNRGAQGMASPAPAHPQPGGGACPAPCPRARRRNRARRRVSRPRTGAGDTRETGFRRTGRPAADRGATGGRRQRPLPPRPTRNRAEECVLRPALARAQAQSGARTAPPRIAPADGRRRYARNRVPPHRPAGGGPGRNRGGGGAGNGPSRTGPPAAGRRSAPCALPSRAQTQSGARTASPRNARAAGRGRYARNSVPPLRPAGGGEGRSRAKGAAKQRKETSGTGPEPCTEGLSPMRRTHGEHDRT